jgi:hypothetical protein
LDEVRGLNGGPTIGQQTKNHQLDMLGMLAAMIPGIGAEKMARRCKLPPAVWQELKKHIDHDMTRQLLDRVLVTDGPSNGKKPIRRS